MCTQENQPIALTGDSQALRLAGFIHQSTMFTIQVQGGMCDGQIVGRTVTCESAEV